MVGSENIVDVESCVWCGGEHTFYEKINKDTHTAATCQTAGVRSKM